MPRATHVVTIMRSPSDVFVFLADGTTASQWRPGVIDIRRVAGDGAGARFEQGVRGPMGRRIAADYQITAYDPNRRLEFQTMAGPVRPHGRYDLEAVEGGTRLTFSLEAQLGGWRRLLLGSAVQRTMNAEVRSLENLKRVLEA